MLTKANTNSQKILDFLEKHGPATSQQIEKGTGIQHESMSSVLQKMLARKLIGKTLAMGRTAKGNPSEMYDLYDRVTGKQPTGFWRHIA